MKFHDQLKQLESKYGSENCWPWPGRLNSTGYGRSMVADKTKKYRQRSIGAHRRAYLELVGPIPAGLVLDHSCRKPSCVNPKHLRPVTQRENLKHGMHGAAKTHCVRGHELKNENVYIWTSKNGTIHRICKMCRTLWVTNNLERRREIANRYARKEKHSKAIYLREWRKRKTAEK